jgi:hypothetical protein
MLTEVDDLKKAVTLFFQSFGEVIMSEFDNIQA